MRIGDNHQSGSDYQVWASTSMIQDGTVYPVIRPDFSAYIINYPIREASRGTNFRTHSLFLNDSWAYNRNFTFNLGLRWDKNDGQNAIGQVVARDSAVSPRLGMVWDPKGDGRTGSAPFFVDVPGTSTQIRESLDSPSASECGRGQPSGRHARRRPRGLRLP